MSAWLGCFPAAGAAPGPVRRSSPPDSDGEHPAEAASASLPPERFPKSRLKYSFLRNTAVFSLYLGKADGCPRRLCIPARVASISPAQFGVIHSPPGGSHGQDTLRGEGRTLPRAHRSAGGLGRKGALGWVAAGGQRCHRGVTSGGCRGRGVVPRSLSLLAPDPSSRRSRGLAAPGAKAIEGTTPGRAGPLDGFCPEPPCPAPRPREGCWGLGAGTSRGSRAG